MSSKNRYRMKVAGLFVGVTIGGTFAAFGVVVPAERPIEGRFIVVLRSDATFRALPGEPAAQADERGARELALANGGEAGRIFSSALRGFVLEGRRSAAENVARDPRVAFVAEDGWVEVSGGSQTPTPSWGLDRIDQRPTELDTTYSYAQDGSEVDLYVVDSGIRATHVDFEGRVDTVNAFTAIDDGRGTDDCNGHGTHVAGIAGSASYGVAKGVTIHPVRVVGCDGMGPVSNVIAGIDWLTARHASAGSPRAVVNISLDNSYSEPLDLAVAASIAQGIVYTVAAGNHGEDASCFLSPQRLPEAITVGASTEDGARWVDSNFGGCVDLFAPGQDIISTFPVDDDATLAMTGTSMAAPHVAGAAALYLAAHPEATPAEVQAAILAAATVDALSDVGENSANLLLFTSFAGEGTAPVELFVDGFEGGTTDGWSGVFPPANDTAQQEATISREER